MKKFVVLTFLFTLIVYFATSAGRTPYDYFTRLSDSFLQGKLYLTENPPWLNELVPAGLNKFPVENRFYVVYPPGPSIIAIPFVLIFGNNFQQQILSQLMGALAAVIWGLIAYKKSAKRLTSAWVTLLVAFGNIIWYLSATGSVWYTGQASAFLFLTLTIYESLNRKRPLLLAFFFGLAFLSRLQVSLALPFIVYLNREKFRDLKKLISFGLGLSFFGIIYGIYNYLRFGSFTETGYGLIPGVLSEPWYGGSLFAYSHIVSNLKVMFFSLPIITRSLPFIEPSWAGLAIWITSPVFIYMFRANIKSVQNIMAWISIFLIAGVIFLHGGTGFAQFGYRYAVDFYPLILFLIVEGVSKTKLKWHHWLLLSVSILVNLWGVIFINKFGWVRY